MINIFKKIDTSPCKYYLQENGECPFEKIRGALQKFVFGKRQRCEGKECLRVAKGILGIKDERELLDKILPEALRAEIYKTRGPADSTALLNQFNIDGVLKDLSYASVLGKIGKPMFHVPFEMRDFKKSIKSELRDLDLDKLVEKDFKHFACVLNTDVWSGTGKHWVCIFATVGGSGRGGSDVKNWCEIEYFNSSGNGLDLFEEIPEWVETLRRRFPKWKITLDEVLDYELQQSETECGVWCLWYIKSRLEGKPRDYFTRRGIDDEMIIEARKYLFSN